ncbi:MAG: hypothetical protein JSU65_11940 [Candidatus Zixiibacteriota bacterium]|nr:MAG: hypothetical protein JSU65_11940 [candidate division Zixibacteria bacterium]
MSKIVSILTIGGTLVACLVACEDDTPITGSRRTIQLEISYGDTVAIPGFPNELIFVDVHDGRCPSNAYCDWEGMAEAVFRFDDGQFIWPLWLPMYGAQVTADTSGYMPVDRFGFHFVMTELSPYPPVYDTTEYKAKVTISYPEQPDSIDGEVEITNQTPSQIIMQSFDLKSVSATGERLNVLLSHGGGCMGHYYWAFMTPDTSYWTDFPEADVYVRHWHFGDDCNALLHAHLTYDLANVIDYYQERCRCVTPIKINVIGDTAGVEMLSTMYFPEDWFISPMLPMAIGNYWVYLDSTWETDHFVETIDSIEVIGTHSDELGDWWVLSSPLPALGDTIMTRGDSVYNRQYRLGDTTPNADLQYVAAQDTSMTFRVATFMGFAVDRTATRVRDMVEVPAGAWVGGYKYLNGLLQLPQTEILVPGVGFVYHEQAPYHPPFPGFMRKTKLIRYHLE